MVKRRLFIILTLVAAILFVANTVRVSAEEKGIEDQAPEEAVLGETPIDSNVFISLDIPPVFCGQGLKNLL